MSSGKTKNINFISGLNLCLVLTIVVSCFYYLKSIDDLVNKNFELQNLKEKVILLEEESQNLEELKNELDSYENMHTRIDELKMVKVNDVNYINLGDDSLAKK